MPSPDGEEGRGTAEGVASVWQLKPWWCQPWSILLTGLAIVASSWWVLRLWWITAVVTLAITAWWVLFLVMMPAAWQAEQAGEGGGGADNSFPPRT